jgi:cytoskeleton protein RodZ
MNEPRDKVSPASESQTPGEFLQNERERKGLSVQQAAENLHLDTWVINAIEKNKFSDLGAPVYAKGHLRKYAALLGLSEEQLLDRYKSMRDAPAAPTLVPEAHRSIEPPNRGRRVVVIVGWLMVVAILLMVALAVWQGR